MRKLIFILFLLMISSCSTIYGHKGVFQNRDTEYLHAQSIPPLRIPPGLSSSTIQTDYPVYERNYPESAKQVSLVPPGLGSD